MTKLANICRSLLVAAPLPTTRSRRLHTNPHNWYFALYCFCWLLLLYLFLIFLLLLLIAGSYHSTASGCFCWLVGDGGEGAADVGVQHSGFQPISNHSISIDARENIAKCFDYWLVIMRICLYLLYVCTCEIWIHWAVCNIARLLFMFELVLKQEIKSGIL